MTPCPPWFIPSKSWSPRVHTGAEFPMDPAVQLWRAIEAVWRSWTLKKAVDYRIGGVMAAPGANAAREILLDLKRNSTIPGNFGDD